MSKQSRNEAAAKAMVEAGQDAAILIEACENKHRLTHEEALDVLCCCVYSFLTRDGETDADTLGSRLLSFADHLAEYASDVFGVKWVLKDDSNETETN